ncbi:hypothetical protein FSZ31_04380 [Sphingorhabdus soli]|uniref:HK97 gp10 family phage protein n=1 Tax=Flavisphingopyxis soli TaxID=2601267 RepID=A0A5C6UN39_9SPHN|nr:HK97-gp10 family putative phage morphogenesis protein [Sphingorhabdus soli]TXC73964.1 hypothetical protein FSZ31_04380 [Sphingorhabdus soli]
MLDFSLSGIEEAIANIRTVGAAVNDDSVGESALAALEPVAEDARSLAPVESGDLRDSIVVSLTLPDGGEAYFDGRAAFVGPLTSSQFYAWFVEMGTVKMRAEPFLLPAIDANEALVFEVLGAGVGQTIMTAV